MSEENESANSRVRIQLEFETFLVLFEGKHLIGAERVADPHWVSRDYPLPSQMDDDKIQHANPH